MNRVSITLLVFALIISGCALTKSSMPAEKPDDFDFKVQFGVQSKNEINTYKDTVTKDLIMNGTATANITLTQEEMAKIYQKMKEINVMEKKDFVPNSNCSTQPSKEDKWKITVNRETIEHHYISSKYCLKTNDAEDFIELRQLIFDIVKKKEDYKKLPDPDGAYALR